MISRRDVLARVVPVLVLPPVWAVFYLPLRFILFADDARTSAELISGLIGFGFALLASDFAASAFERGTWRGYLTAKWLDFRAVPAQISKSTGDFLRAAWQIALFLGALALVLGGLVLAYLALGTVGESLVHWPPWAIVITILLIAILAKR